MTDDAQTRPSIRTANDSMSLHLLVEQAVYDSADYEVLSYEEVEALKKELATLTNRIDASKRKLAMESKVRDAALSLARLTSKKGRRSGGSVASAATQGDDELAASSRKCEELTQELHKLDSRAMVVQKCLLQHSAGILGMTHKSAGAEGAPNSPPGEYTFATAGADDPEAFDDRSFYQTAEKLKGFGELRGSGNGAATNPVDDTLVTERLCDINDEIRGLLRSSGNQGLPQGSNPANSLNEQLAALEQNIQHLRQFPPAASPSPNIARAADELGQTETILTTLWDMIINFDEEVKGKKMDQRNNGHHNPDYPESEDGGETPEFSISAFSIKVQNMLNQVINFRSERDMLRERSNLQERGVEEDMKLMQEDLTNMENQVGQLSNLLQQREEHIEAANAKMLVDAEEFKSLQVLLNQRSEVLEDTQAALGQKSGELINAMHDLDLERSTDKQRTKETKNEFIQEHNALELAREARVDLEQQMDELDKKIADRDEALVELEIKYQDIKEDRDVTKAELEVAVRQSEERIKYLETEIKQTVKSAEASRGLAAGHESQLRQQLDQKGKDLKAMDQEIQELSAKVAEVSMELVMAKVELDSVHGSKSERAAATAEARAAALALERANKQPQSIDPGLLTDIENLEKKNEELIDEIVMLKNERAEGANNEHLDKRCRLLQRELDEMLKDFENLTKQSIETEQERSKLESLIDTLKERVEELETALAEEKIRFLGSPSPRENRQRETTTTNVLKQEFKKMMRDMRAEQARALKVGQIQTTSRHVTDVCDRPRKKSGGS